MPLDHEMNDEQPVDVHAELSEMRRFEENEAHKQMRDIWYRENPAGDMGDPYADCEYEG